MYKHFLEQHITWYNEQWYCYICKLKLESSVKVEHHLQETHRNINIQHSSLSHKSFKLSDKKCKKLLSQGIVLKNTVQYYFCLLCHCSINSLIDVDAHLNGKRHKECMKIKEEDSTDVQQNSSNNADAKYKSFKLSSKCTKSLNHGIVLKTAPQDYFCLPCHCSINSLINVDEHLNGKWHKKCIKTVEEGSKDVQKNSNNNADAKYNDISPKVGVQLKHVNKSNFPAKVQPIVENGLVNNILNGSKIEEKNMKRSRKRNRRRKYEDNINNVKLSALKNISIDKKLEKYNINNNKNGLIATANINSKNDVICQERSSDLFISSDIEKEINKLPKEMNKILQIKQKPDMSVLDRYNKMYQKKFLHFEEIIFVCNEEKLNEIRSNLQYYVTYFNGNMYCLLCNFTHSYDIHELYTHIRSTDHVTQLTQLNANEQHKLISRELMRIESMHVKCYACSQNIEWMHYNAARIEEHILSHSHKKNCKQLLKQTENILKEFETLWYSIQYFACVTCNARFQRKIIFMEHLDKKHKETLNTKDNAKFDFCIACATLWYDELYWNLSKTYVAHCADQMHRYLTEHNNFAVLPLPQMLQNLLQNIDKTIADLFKQSNDILNDSKSDELKNALKQVFEIHDFPKVEVCLFGSRFTGLALQNSDIDIYLNFGKYI